MKSSCVSYFGMNVGILDGNASSTSSSYSCSSWSGWGWSVVAVGDAAAAAAAAAAFAALITRIASSSWFSSPGTYLLETVAPVLNISCSAEQILLA